MNTTDQPRTLMSWELAQALGLPSNTVRAVITLEVQTAATVMLEQRVRMPGSKVAQLQTTLQQWELRPGPIPTPPPAEDWLTDSRRHLVELRARIYQCIDDQAEQAKKDIFLQYGKHSNAVHCAHTSHIAAAMLRRLIPAHF